MISTRILFVSLLLWCATSNTVWAAPQLNMPIQVAQRRPPDRGTPPTQQGTGTRGNCGQPANLPPLTAIVGQNSSGQTIRDRPTFWVYVPYSAQQVASTEFSLQEGERDVYRGPLPLPTSTPGIVGIRLPNDVQPLQVGKTYRWYVDVVCANVKTAGGDSTVTVTGLIARVTPSAPLTTSLKAAKTAWDRYLALLDQNIGFDSLTELAQARLQNPQFQAANVAWEQWLQSEGLGSVAKAAIAGITTPTPSR